LFPLRFISNRRSVSVSSTFPSLYENFKIVSLDFNRRVLRYPGEGDVMKNLWKWVLGIVLVLMAAGAVAVIAFAWRNHVLSGSSFRAMPLDRRWENPVPRDFDGGRHGPMMRLPGGRFGLFGPFIFLGGLARLAIFGALLYGAYWLGKRNARVVLDPASGGQRTMPSTSGSVTKPEAAPTRDQMTEKNE
jgi:hypothetical protein